MTGKPVLAPGDELCFDGGQHQVLGLSGTSVRLRSTEGTHVEHGDRTPVTCVQDRACPGL